MSLEDDLTYALRGTVAAAQKHGYNPTYFTRMLDEHGGVETARRLLDGSAPQEGLFRLWELHLLDESLEAVVLQERFSSLFNPVQIAEARRRLEELGYFKRK